MTTWSEAQDGTAARIDLGAGGFIKFQAGPVKETGVNGTTIESVALVLIDRLEGFQRGAFANSYNAEAIAHFRAGVEALLRRTADREARGVEGLNKA